MRAFGSWRARGGRQILYAEWHWYQPGGNFLVRQIFVDNQNIIHVELTFFDAEGAGAHAMIDSKKCDLCHTGSTYRTVGLINTGVIKLKQVNR